MAKYALRKVAAVSAIAALATFGLSACATPAPEPTQSAIGGDIVAPIEINYQDIDGQTIELVVGQVVNINYGGINDGEITVAIRYFPNESHFNAMNAALAVEAALAALR